MKCFIAIAVLVGVCNAAAVVKREAKVGSNGDQNPKVFSALDKLRGRDPLSIPEIQELYVTAVAGQDYPLNSEIPKPSVDCASAGIGYYADDSGVSKCQAFHRCDANNEVTSYLCPNQSLFNQITLICDWWYNIDCSQAKSFVDYSNSRLRGGDDLVILDDENDYEQKVKEVTGAVKSSKDEAAAAPQAKKAKKGKKAKKAAAAE